MPCLKLMSKYLLFYRKKKLEQMSVNLLFNLALNTGIIMKYNFSVVECPSNPILVVVLVIAWIWFGCTISTKGMLTSSFYRELQQTDQPKLIRHVN